MFRPFFYLIIIIFSVSCLSVCIVCHSLCVFPLGVIGMLWSVIVALLDKFYTSLQHQEI